MDGPPPRSIPMLGKARGSSSPSFRLPLFVLAYQHYTVHGGVERDLGLSARCPGWGRTRPRGQSAVAARPPSRAEAQDAGTRGRPIGVRMPERAASVPWCMWRGSDAGGVDALKATQTAGSSDACDGCCVQ
ncbi:hypothetical protein VTO42DRAFT_3811 [Malbranchea cinnamomea]